MTTVRIVGMRTGQTLPRLLPEISAAHSRGSRVLVIVPEQYTLQAEFEITEGLHLPGLLDLDVLSPKRLRKLIRERAGSLPMETLDDRGQAMAISQALAQERGELSWYAGAAEQPGLPDKLRALITDLQKAAMTPERLAAHADAQPLPATRAKERDIARIWAAYLELIRGRFLDDDAAEQDMLRRLKRSGIMRDACVFVCGFDVLQPQLCRMLAETAEEAASLTVAMTMDWPEAPDARLFRSQNASAGELAEELKRQGIAVRREQQPADDQGKAAAFIHLEKHLFARACEPFQGDCSPIALYMAANPYAEALHAAAALRKWHNEGIPWSEMAVAVAEPASLNGVTEAVLSAARIPHYLARKEPAAGHGLCRMLLGAVRAACGVYQSDDVALCLLSGFTLLSESEALTLRTYARENGIKRKKWTVPFTRGDAEQAEPLRETFMTPLIHLHDRLLSARTADASAEAVLALLQEMGAYERLAEREKELLERGMLTEATRNRQVWQTVMDLLDQMHALFNGQRAAMRDLARLLETGLSGASISGLPAEPDTVTVGEAGHVMTGRIRCLVVMGMQDGTTSSPMNSLITDAERTELTLTAGRRVGLLQTVQNSLRLSDFYRTLTLPEEKLLLTCSASGFSGEAKRPASLVGDLQRTFPGVRMEGGVLGGSTDSLLLSPRLALSGLAKCLRGISEGKEPPAGDWGEALIRLQTEPEDRNQLTMLGEALHAQVGAGPLRDPKAQGVFQRSEMSISRLESFAQCPYRHFLAYGLRPKKKKEFSFEADERGTFYHAVLERYTNLAVREPDWPEVPEERVDALLDQVIPPLQKLWDDGPLAEDEVARRLGREYERTVRRAAKVMTAQARRAKFRASSTEVSFGMDGGLPPVILELADGEKVALRGKIDRIDRWAGDEGLYLRVIDNKSGNLTMDPVRIRWGLQLQLLIYLHAAVQGEHALPAGAFYFHVGDPLVKSDSDIKEKAEELIARELKLSGVMLADTEVIRAMGGDDDSVLGKVLTKDGISSKALAFDLEGLRSLTGHALRTAADLAGRIRRGCIDISPAVIGDWEACTWCPYAAVCGRDAALSGGEGRELSGSTEEIWAELTGTAFQDGQEN